MLFGLIIHRNLGQNLSPVLIIDHHERQVSEINQLKRIMYTRDDLLKLRSVALNNKNMRTIPNYQALRNIKQLRINKRRIRLQNWRKLELRKVNMNNLANLPLDPDHQILNNKNIIFGTVNARSVKQNFPIILDLLVRENLDFLVITESWLKDSAETRSWLNAQALHDLNYKHDNVPRPGRKRGGGLLLLYKKTFSLTKLDGLKLSSCESAVWKLNTNNYSFTCIGVYHPPGAAKDQVSDVSFTDELTDKLSLILPDLSSVIITGDFNIHVNDVSDDGAIFFTEALLSLGLHQHVHTSTHNKGNILDLILTNPDELPILKCEAVDFVSDHRMVVCQTNLLNPKPQPKSISVRKYTPEKIAAFKDSLDFTTTFAALDLNDAVSKFEDQLSIKLDLHIPVVNKKVQERRIVPWFVPELKAQRLIVRGRERCWIKYMEDQHWKAYARERLRYNNMVKYHKTCFFQRSVLNCKGDTKSLYQLINKLTSKVKVNPMPPNVPDMDLAENFADFFLNKILKIRELFVDVPIIDLDVRESIPLLKRFAPVSENETRLLISSMKTKTCELDVLPTHILKQLLDTIVPPLTHIINLSLSTGVFANKWKSALVKPLLKKEGLELIYKNYRPVSNLKFVSKLVEKSVLNQFIQHCNDYQLIPDYQSAYRKDYSCETSVIKLLNDGLWAMEKQNVLPILFLDLSAAFDTVDHDLFLSILQKRFAITDEALCWFDSYLRPRSFRVVVSDSVSSSKDLTFSVPQGSAAGANFFTAYCESLPSVLPLSITLQGFADDHFMHKMFKAGDQAAEKDTIDLLSEAFNNTQTWMTAMRLKLNSDKTEFLILGSTPQLNKLTTKTISVGSSTVERSRVVKCLGTYFDENLNFKHHVEMKCKAATFNFHRIKSIRKFLTKETCETLVLSLVMSHIDYSNGVLVGAPDVLINKLQRIQNMCAKLVLLRTKYDSAKQALKDLHWLPVRLRINFKICVLTYKSVNHIGPEYLTSLLKFRESSTRTLRSNVLNNKLLLEVPKTKLKTFAARSFSVKGPEMWNELPESLRLSQSISVFKSSLKTFLFDKF